QCGRKVAQENARLQHREARPVPVASLNEHLEEFDFAWNGMQRKWLACLTKRERAAFDELDSDNEREAFRIVRNWWQNNPAEPDFKIRAESLAERLGITLPGACGIRNKFCAADILRLTAPHVPRQLCCRYRWLLCEPLPKIVREAIAMFDGRASTVQNEEP